MLQAGNEVTWHPTCTTAGVMWKHQALLSFVERIAHDREFREWYVANPAEALQSHGLSGRELRDLEHVLATERQERELATALRPFVHLLLESAAPGDLPSQLLTHDPHLTYERLTAEVEAMRARVAAAREAQRRRRPWWKFWE